MLKIDYSYHTHTYRCGHACGEDEDYILDAIKYGLKRLGMSDHIMLPKIHQEGMRGDYHLLKDYLISFRYLQKKYVKQIDLKLGFEAEYSPELLQYYKSLLNSKKIDYLILGQHCFMKNGVMTWYASLPYSLGICKYTDDLIEGMSTGLFKYVAHPDLFVYLFPRWDEKTKCCAQKIIDAAVQYDIPLEINLAHARYYGLGYISPTTRFTYPFIPFWEMVAKSKARVVIGFDAHMPEHILKPGLNYVEEIIAQTGVKVDCNYKI